MPRDGHLHAPCMLAETLKILDPQPGDVLVDMTLGLAGHATAILEKTARDGPGVLIDWDPSMLALAEKRLAPYHDRIKLFNRNFTELPHIMEEAGVEYTDLAILDAGVALPQLLDTQRGFGFQGTSLAMSMADPNDARAAEIINTAPEAQLRSILRRTQSEHRSKLIARAICRARQRKLMESSSELAEVIAAALPRGRRKSSRHPATAAMLAFRIFANQELDNLRAGVEAMAAALRPGAGRMVVLTYHSLEFRTTRDAIQCLATGHAIPPWLPAPADARPLIRSLTKKPLKPSDAEATTCRSCRLFAAQAV